MQDDELTGLCKKIYRRHREAIDLIVDLGKVNVFQQSAENALLERGGYEVLCLRPRQVWFLPDSYTSLLYQHHPSRGLNLLCLSVR